LSGFDLRGLVEALNAHGVEFIAIGGVAVGAQGFVRATEDLDIVPDPTLENLGRLIGALVDLDASLPTAEDRPFDRDRDGLAVKRGANVPANTRLGALDIVQIAKGVPPYSQLAEDAADAEITGVPLRVCSLARLREMKRAQGRAIDLADLEGLPEE
jgi:hypothetical protein